MKSMKILKASQKEITLRKPNEAKPTKINLRCFTWPQSDQGLASAEPKTSQNKTLIFLFFFFKMEINTLWTSNLKFDPRDNLNGKLLTQVDFMTSLTSRKTAKTREI